MERREVVLMIDDDPTLASLYQMILESEGIACAVAGKISDALRYIENNGMPALIFLDCNMRTEHGDDFLEQFEKMAAPRCVVIGFSFFPRGSKLIEQFESRVDHYVEKTDDLDQFIALARKFLKAKKTPAPP